MILESYLKDVNIEQIKLAIGVEEKHQFIDIKGKESTFSSFIKKELQRIYKLSKKDPKWLPLVEGFEAYPQENLPQRKKTIKRLINLLKSELNPSAASQSEQDRNEDPFKKSIYEQDVTYVKGVGPKELIY